MGNCYKYNTMIYEHIEKAWKNLTEKNPHDFKSRVPSLVSLNAIDIELVQETDNRVVIAFTNFAEAVSESQDIPRMKELIKNWLKQIGIVRIRRADNRSFIVELSNFEIDSINKVDEAVVKVFTRKNNKLVPAMKCLGGPKNGQRTKDVATCMEPPSYAKRTARKISSRKNKGAIANKRKKTKLTNIIGRNRLKKANARLKKARGGKF